MRRPRGDCQAIEYLPLRLMIVAVVASMSVVPAAEALDTLRTKEFLRRAEFQLEQIVSTAQALSL